MKTSRSVDWRSSEIWTMAEILLAQSQAEYLARFGHKDGLDTPLGQLSDAQQRRWLDLARKTLG